MDFDDEGAEDVETVREDVERVPEDDERVPEDNERVREDDEGVEDFGERFDIADEEMEDDDREIQDDDDETLTTTIGSRGGDDDADDEIEEMAYYVDDVIFRLDSEATRRNVSDAARRFQNFVNERIDRIRNLRTPPEADEE